MLSKFNQYIDKISDFLAHKKGLLPIVGILLVLVNAALQFLPIGGWMIDSNLFLHLGVIVALLGVLLAWAL
jgi:hypothetical protein